MVQDVFDAVGQVALLVKEIDKDVDAGGFLVGKGVFARLRVQVLLEIFFAGDVGQHIFAFVSADLTRGRGVMAEFGIGKFIRFFAFEQGLSDGQFSTSRSSSIPGICNTRKDCCSRWSSCWVCLSFIPIKVMIMR